MAAKLLLFATLAAILIVAHGKLEGPKSFNLESFCNESLRAIEIRGQFFSKKNASERLMCELHARPVAKTAIGPVLVHVEMNRALSDNLNQSYLTFRTYDNSGPEELSYQNLDALRKDFYLEQNPLRYGGHEFHLRIIFGPSHYLFIVGDGKNETRYQIHYGDVSVPKDRDGLIEQLRCLGDAEFKTVKISSGGQMITNVRSYSKSYNLDFLAVSKGQRLALMSNWSSEVIGDNEEWELSINGKFTQESSSRLLKFAFYAGDCDLLVVAQGFANNSKFDISSATSPFEPEKCGVLQPHLKDGDSKLMFIKDVDFIFSLRKLNDGRKDTKDLYQITIQVQCRIATWYVRINQAHKIDSFAITGGVIAYQVVVASQIIS